MNRPLAAILMALCFALFGCGSSGPPHAACDEKVIPTCGSFGSCDQRVNGATTIALDTVSRGANAVRLDDIHLVAAYPASGPPITQVLLKVVAFDGCGYAVSEPYALATDVIDPDMTQGLQAMGALGPNHFFLVTVDSSEQMTFHFFRRDGKSLTLLDSRGLEAYEVGGHPVDDTRYLLRYRKSNSADPVTYQLLVRDGDAITFGASIERPGTSSFPGLSAYEPQTWSPLLRVGPATFREIRGGYVYSPGYLGSWLLTVDSSNELKASDPLVYATSGTKTMSPLVAANGTGEGVVLYNQYNDGRLSGYFTSSPFAYHHHPGFLSDDSDYYGTQSRDSSDGYIGGKYYLRTEVGVVYRFDTVDAPAAVEATGLPWSVCYYAPSVMKLGSWGAFVVCDSDSASLRLLPL
jgi:hypothetical protein